MNGDEVLKWKSTLEFLRKPLNYAYRLFCYRLHPVDQIRMTAALTLLKIPLKMSHFAIFILLLILGFVLTRKYFGRK